MWPAVGGGSSGFVDLEYGPNQQYVATVEVHDDGYREPTTKVAEFEARNAAIT